MDFIVLDKLIQEQSPDLVKYLQSCSPINGSHHIANDIINIVNNMITYSKNVFEGKMSVWIEETSSFEDIHVQHGQHHIALMRRQYLELVDSIVESDAVI